MPALARASQLDKYSRHEDVRLIELLVANTSQSAKDVSPLSLFLSYFMQGRGSLFEA